MRKIVAALFALLLFSSIAGADAFYRLKGTENRAASRSGTLDSLSFTLNPVAAGAETLAIISTVDWDFSNPSLTELTAQPIARLWLTTNTGVGFTGDSLYMCVQVSSDGLNWNAGTFVGAAATVAGDKVMGLPITVDADAGGADPWRAPSIRLLIREDSGSSASAYITNATVVYPSLTQRTR